MTTLADVLKALGHAQVPTEHAAHNLFPPSLESKVPPLYSQEHEKDPIVHGKLFSPWSNWRWFIVEAEVRDEDVTFFGLVQGFDVELGYFSLNELKQIQGPHGLKIERDLYFIPKTVSECRKEISDVDA